MSKIMPFINTDTMSIFDTKKPTASLSVFLIFYR